MRRLWSTFDSATSRDGCDLGGAAGHLVAHDAAVAEEEERHHHPEADEADEGRVERRWGTVQAG